MALGGYGSGRGNHLLRDQREWWRGARVEDRPSAGAADQRYGAWRLRAYGSGRERSRKPSSSGSTRIPSKSWTFAPGTCGSTSAARRVLALWLCARPPRLATSSPRAKRSLVSLHSHPFPVRTNREGRSPRKSSIPSFDRFSLSKPPPAVVMEPPRAQISIK